jgi:hypothetical protein
MKKYIFFTLALILTGLLTYIFTPRPYQVHHHANFAVYKDGQMVDFSNSVYMEETSRCNITTDIHAEDRIHLHDNKGNLVHVHMAASTWGDLFANLSWGIGNGYLVDQFGQIYTGTGDKNLFFFINGKKVDNPTNEIVKSTDRLLVWYGTGTFSEIQPKWGTLVPDDADEYNHKADPASCGTNNYGWISPLMTPILEWKEKVFHDHK